jgi:hypothetical protein
VPIEGQSRSSAEGQLLIGTRTPSSETATITASAGTVSCAQDGGQKQATRARGILAKGPAGYNEASCGTLSFYDRKGELLQTQQIGRMPEQKKTTR